MTSGNFCHTKGVVFSKNSSNHIFYLLDKLFEWFWGFELVDPKFKKGCQKAQDTVDHTPAGTGNYFSHGSLSKNFFVEFKSESLKNKKVSIFQQL